jgi:hypothetical protein
LGDLRESNEYVVPHLVSRGIRIEWDSSGPEPRVEFPLQLSGLNAANGATLQLGDYDPYHQLASGLLQITALLPYEEINTSNSRVCETATPADTGKWFRVGLRSGGTICWVDMCEWGILRLPIFFPAPGLVGTAAVLTSIPIPLSAFSTDAEFIGGVESVLFDLSSDFDSGAIMLQSINVELMPADPGVPE